MFGEKKKSVIPVIIAILLLVVFFVSTRDYEKFKLLDKEVKSLDPRLEPVVQATKECNKLEGEIDKSRCYEGVSYAAGYYNFGNYSDICLNMMPDRFKIMCYRGAGTHIGEEFYNNISEMFLKCEEAPDWLRFYCEDWAVVGASRVLTYYNKSLDHCDAVEKDYKWPCYYGLGWGLSEQYFPEQEAEIMDYCYSLGNYSLSCAIGSVVAVGEYLAVNVSFAEIIHQVVKPNWPEGRRPERLYNHTAFFIGYYGGIASYEKDLDIAFAVCKSVSENTESLREDICREGIYRGVGFSSYSKLVNQSWSP